MEELIKKAEQGDAEAQFQLGVAYYNGEAKPYKDKLEELGKELDEYLM